MTFQKKETVARTQFDFLSDAWQRCIDSWLLEKYQLSGSTQTRREYTREINAFLSQIGKSPERASREEVLQHIHATSRSPRNPGAAPTISTINCRLAIVKSLYSYSATYTITDEHGYPQPLLRTAPPTLGMKARHVPINPKYMSLEEIERLFSVIPRHTERGARDYCLLLFYLLSAKRRNEIATLKFKDIEPAILIDANGRREGWCFRYRNKGASQENDLQELPLLVKNALDRYIELSGRQITPDSPLFVPTQLNSSVPYDQSQQLTDTTVNRRLKHYCKLAGLSTSYSLHSLRHSSARLRYTVAGEDLVSVSHTLRHASIATTHLYVARIASPVDQGARALELMFSRFS